MMRFIRHNLTVWRCAGRLEADVEAVYGSVQFCALELNTGGVGLAMHVRACLSRCLALSCSASIHLTTVSLCDSGFQAVCAVRMR